MNKKSIGKLENLDQQLSEFADAIRNEALLRMQLRAAELRVVELKKSLLLKNGQEAPPFTPPPKRSCPVSHRRAHAEANSVPKATKNSRASTSAR